MKLSKYFFIIYCFIFGHEFKNIGNQNGRYLKCIRCKLTINKIDKFFKG